jgi:hypothetical protein
MIDILSKLKSFPNIILYANIILVIYIYSIRDKNRTFFSINNEIYKSKNTFIYISIVALIGLLVLLGLLGFLYGYREVIAGGGVGVFILWIIFAIIYIYHLSLSINYAQQTGEDVSQDYKDDQLKNYMTKNISIIVSCIIMFYIGLTTHSIRGKVGLTMFIGLYMLYIFMKIWDFTIEHDIYNDINMDKTEGARHRYIYIFSLVILIFLLNVIKNIKIYDVGFLIYVIGISIYNIWIITRNKTLVSRFSDILFPLILFIFYSILNFKEFQENSINTKFVYGLGFIITMVLLYIITNTDDIKIKSFITIFLVVIYNILAIIYGSKDCDISGFKLLKRTIKWSILVVIITFVLWKDFFQTSINDNLQEIGDSSGGESYLTDTSELERKLRIAKGNNSEINEGDKNDERVQLQSKVNRLYESRARRDL